MELGSTTAIRAQLCRQKPAVNFNLMTNKIKELRGRHNLTQEELAQKVGVRRETILFLEAGKYNPSLKLAHDVAVALGTTIDELFRF